MFSIPIHTLEMLLLVFLIKCLLISIEADWEIKIEDFQENLDDNGSIQSYVRNVKFEVLL